MNGAWLTGRRGQAVAVAATVLIVLVVWAGTVRPLLGWYADRAELVQQRRAIADHMSALVATLPALRRQAEAGTAAPAPAATLSGDSDAVAGAMLQERVQAMANDTGANLSSVETLPAETAGAWRRIGLRLSLTAPWPVLVRLLQRLDQSNPEMLVDDLHLHSLLLNAPGTAARPLQATLNVFAFRPASAPAAAR